MGLRAAFALHIGGLLLFPAACAGRDELVPGEVDLLPPPVAVCGVTPPSTTPGTAVVFDGGASYDRAGVPIVAYDWALVGKPPGSTVDLPGGSGPSRTFLPDYAGAYVAELVVTNERGERSEPCSTTLDVPGAEGLSIRLTWDTPGADLDLHLVRPGGRVFDGDDDCHFANPHPDWGAPGYDVDDPELLGDDIEGVGPEEIVQDLLRDQGAYEVWTSGGGGATAEGSPATVLTVVLSLEGVEVYADTRSCEGACAHQHFADIDSTTGAVTGR